MILANLLYMLPVLPRFIFERERNHSSAFVSVQSFMSSSATKKPYYDMTTENRKPQYGFGRSPQLLTGPHCLPPKVVVVIPLTASFYRILCLLQSYHPHLTHTLPISHQHHYARFQLSLLQRRRRHSLSLHQPFMWPSKSSLAKGVFHFLP